MNTRLNQKPQHTKQTAKVEIPNTPYVRNVGRNLYLNGKPYTFTGINAYYIATQWGVNAGCGGMLTNAEMDTFFSLLRPKSVVRFWAFQSQAVNIQTRELDFSPIDRVVEAAERHNIKLIMVIGNEWKDCDVFKKTESWYQNGYQQVDGNHLLSYWDYIHRLVPRYAYSTTLAMWELINEPETPNDADTSCSPTSSKTLRTFFDIVGGEVHWLDPNHLVSSGVIGNGQCGAQQKAYEYIHKSPGIDVASYHDYGYPDKPLPGDTWNGFLVRINQMKTINKPLYVGESGMLAQDNLIGCMNFSDRVIKIKAKMDAQFTAGIVGFLPWNWSSINGGTCNYDIPPIDPLFDVLNSYPLPFYQNPIVNTSYSYLEHNRNSTK